jgi:putative peptidoglycan lipid II flippase
VIFDWLLVGGPTPWGNQSPLNFGAPGLVLATVAINGITCLALLVVLQRRLHGLPLRSWGLDAFKLSMAGLVAALPAWGISGAYSWPVGILGLLLQVTVPGLLGLGLFAWLGTKLGVREVRELVRNLTRRFRAR